MQDDKKNISADENQKFTDEQTDKRTHEILSNEKDEVSEQDINNIITGSAITDAAASVEAMLPGKIHDDEDLRINAPLNILEGGD